MSLPDLPALCAPHGRWCDLIPAALFIVVFWIVWVSEEWR